MTRHGTTDYFVSCRSVEHGLMYCGWGTSSHTNMVEVFFLAAQMALADTMRGCRMRISIFATTSWPDIHSLLTKLIIISLKLKITGVRPALFDESFLERPDTCDDLAIGQSHVVNNQILDFIDLLRVNIPINSGQVGSAPDVIEAGVGGLHKYGIGPCSARWFWGSFDSFLHLEQRLAKLYPSLVKQSGRCRGMICGDAEITLGSTLSALVTPLASSTTVNTVFVDANAPKGILDGAGVSKDKKHVTRKYYNDVKDIPKAMNFRTPTHLTLYFLTCSASRTNILDLPQIFADPAFRNNRTAQNIKSITIMLDDRYGLGKIGPNKLGYLDHMEFLHGDSWLVDTFKGLNKRVRIIVAGSWYDAFGHQGGYVTGYADTVEALTWDARAYFFSTPPMPLQACMTERAIRILEDRRERRRKGEVME